MCNKVNTSNFILWASVIFSVLYMFLGPKQDGALVDNTFEALKFFTVESNLFIGIVAFISYLYNKRGKNPLWLTVLKYVATGSVALTFFTVVFYLGPLIGILSLLVGPNLYMHLITPVLAMIYFIFIEPRTDEFKFKHTFLCPLPCLIYGVGYITNVALTNGYGTTQNDWYAFGTFGLGIGIAVFGVMIIFMYGIGVGLYFAHKKVKRS